MTASAQLRARTAAAHARVDDAFSAYDLGNRTDYKAFLLAHSRALPVAEKLIQSDRALPTLRARTVLLEQDMKALDQAMPSLLPFAPFAAAGGRHAAAAAWGILYVVEGSRLGGGILARRVAAELPTAYLDALHQPGEWSKFRQALDTEAAQHDAAWIDTAVQGAKACFDLYERSCRNEG